ncbi:hypothetical protein Aperf_G00000114258 [Anoplocephala perfoliata]
MDTVQTTVAERTKLTEGMDNAKLSSKLEISQNSPITPVIDVPLLTAALLQAALAAELSENALKLFQTSTQTMRSPESLPIDLRTLAPDSSKNSDEKESNVAGPQAAQINRVGLIPTERGQNENHIVNQQPLNMFTEMEGPLDFSTCSRELPCPHFGCNRTFRYNHALINHYRIHTGERPYVCDFPGCKQAFARHSNLLTHRMVHLNRAMRKTFACTVPGCEKNFLKKTNLDDHMNLHLNRRPYTCDYPNCGKSFRCRSNLSGHRRVHFRELTKKTANRHSPLKQKIETTFAEANINTSNQNANTVE